MISQDIWWYDRPWWSHCLLIILNSIFKWMTFHVKKDFAKKNYLCSSFWNKYLDNFLWCLFLGFCPFLKRFFNFYPSKFLFLIASSGMNSKVFDLLTVNSFLFAGAFFWIWAIVGKEFCTKRSRKVSSRDWASFRFFFLINCIEHVASDLVGLVPVKDQFFFCQKFLQSYYC